MEFFATCAAGFEQVLAGELTGLGLSQVRPLAGQVAFQGEIGAALTACLWSRIASRVIAVVGRVDAVDSDALYEGINALPWEEHLPATARVEISSHGTNEQLRNTRFVSLRAKDAISDRLLAKRGTRLVTDTDHPTLRLELRLRRDRATVGIDLAGTPLFRRAYATARPATDGLPPLRADYAAALLAQAGWFRACRSDGPVLVAAWAGSGDLLVEAAAQAQAIAPGLSRTRWGFTGWALHEPAIWDRLIDEAQAQAEWGAERTPRLISLDPRQGTRRASRQALQAAGIAVRPTRCDPSGLADALAEAQAQAPTQGVHAVADLSWLDASDAVASSQVLRALAELSQALPPDTPLACLAVDDYATSAVGSAPESSQRVIVGRDPAVMSLYRIPATHPERSRVTLRDGREVAVSVPASDQFAARLEKVARQRAKWARREDVSCYRVYDADLPDYAVSIDLFQGAPQTPGRWLQVSEYAAPKDVDPALARARLTDVLAIAPEVLGTSASDVRLRVRSHSKGGSQYADADSSRSGSSTRDPRQGRDTLPVGDNPRVKPSPVRLKLAPGARLVEEGGLAFEVSMNDRLDCGLFLDTRDVRAMLREMAKYGDDPAIALDRKARAQAGKPVDNFLNLFAYTGTATCYAADGGARHTTTVDLSRTYLDWAERNMARNGFDGRDHEFVQADVIGWIAEQRHTYNRWQLIYCDPPTFSNSSRMRKRSFDIQRDHVELLIGVSRLLARGGVCVFVCNLRSFRPDEAALAKAGVSIEDITPSTIPEDFARNPKVHHCYLVRRG